MPTSVLISDPQFLTREGLYNVLKQEKYLDVKVAENSVSLDRYLNKYQPDILIIDYLTVDPLPKGLDLVKHLAKTAVGTSLLVISDDEEAPRIRQALNHGVKGFLTKNCESEEILAAVQNVARGKRFFCNRVLEVLTDLEFNETANITPTNLSKREFEVLKFIAKGYTTFRIADKLNISVHTVNSHRKNILKKLNVKSPTQLVAYAHQAGLVS